MKQLTVIMILILISSCNPTNDPVNDPVNDSTNDFENYDKGVELLGAVNADDQIDYLKAIEYFDKSIQSNPNHIESKYWKVHCEFKLGNFDEVLVVSKSVISNPKMKNYKMLPDFYVYAGLVEKVNGNYQESNLYFSNALDNYNSWINYNENDTQAIMNKAMVLCYMGKKNKAISFLDLISSNNKNQTEFEQIRQGIVDFDSEEFVNELVKGRE